MKIDREVIIGSRGSQLALWQAGWVKEQLEHHFPSLKPEIRIIKTTGDKILDSPLSRIGDKGLFTKEIEHALLNHEIDIAVHSLKDLPTILPAGLSIGAITKREDVHDVFIAHPRKQHRKFADLPVGAMIATGSLRRKAQLLSWRKDIRIIDFRGNLNTRFAKLESSDWDGMVLAKAGVIRLGFRNRITEILPLDRVLPAVGQGALAIEIREDDNATLKYVQSLGSHATTLSTKGERAFLRYLEGGCQVPIGAYGRIVHGEFCLDAMIGSLDGRKILRGKARGIPERSEELGTRLAETLFTGGGKEILKQIRMPEPEAIPAA
ncbi:MAG TPA: hydroxymethylbilane synthase [Bacteroidota bacterium]|nr:hydroxymethylbilane synthase [Bacteroidota bacterium]